MKKILYIGTAVAIAMGFTSCQKDNITEGQISGHLIRETFSAGFEQTATKTTISDDANTVNWAAGDKVYYYSKDGGDARNFTIANAGASAALTLEREDGDTYYNLVYAGNAVPTFTTKTGTSMVFDGVKSEQEGAFQSANISVGRTTPGGSGITFKPVTALVKFTTARTDIKTIVLTGGDGEKVAGDITVDPTAASPKAELSGDGSTSITVTIGTPAAGTYYINVLPGTYSKGLKLVLRNESGVEVGVVNASKSIDLNAAGKMINFGNIDGRIVQDYFYFEAVEAGAAVALKKKTNAPACSFQKSTDGAIWSDYSIDTPIPLANAGDKVYFKANGSNTTLSDGDSYYYFSSTDTVNVGGNIMYLLNGTNPGTSITGEYAFYSLFDNMTTLKSAAELRLPATTLAADCYDAMFYKCQSLTTAPALPATALADYCYFEMFHYCKALVSAPELPAETLTDECYKLMFSRCSSLTTAPTLPATTLAGGCYESMFENCISLTTAPAKLPATTLADTCYNSMFRNCTSLMTAPALPADTLVDRCYEIMFAGCTSLTTAPTLPATTLAAMCYYSMFSNCTSLESAPALNATTLANSCYYCMFYNCSSLTTAPTLSAPTLAPGCYMQMFNSCSKLGSVTMLATDVNETNNSLYGWLSGAGTNAASPKLYVDPTMTTNSYITAQKGSFTITAIQ